MAILFPKSPRSESLAKNHGYDEWLISRFLQYVPNVEQFLSKMDKPPTQYIRVNTLKTTKEGLLGRLSAKGFVLKQTVLDEVFAVQVAPMSTGATTEYLLGHYYIQDLSSCIAVEALDVQKGQTILDMAAAPGGKTTFIAQKMANTGAIIALEASERRTRSLSFNLERLGVCNTCVCKTDGAKAEGLSIQFDGVLLDAPCSCEGVIAKDPSRKISHKPKDVDYCSSRQEKMLEAAIKVAKRKGIVVYSTCSFAPEENEVIVDRMVQKFGVTVEPLAYGSEGMPSFGGIKFDPSVRNARRFYPHIHDTTGFFIARLRT